MHVRNCFVFWQMSATNLFWRFPLDGGLQPLRPLCVRPWNCLEPSGLWWVSLSLKLWLSIRWLQHAETTTSRAVKTKILICGHWSSVLSIHKGHCLSENVTRKVYLISTNLIEKDITDWKHAFPNVGRTFLYFRLWVLLAAWCTFDAQLCPSFPKLTQANQSCIVQQDRLSTFEWDHINSGNRTFTFILQLCRSNSKWLRSFHEVHHKALDRVSNFYINLSKRRILNHWSEVTSSHNWWLMRSECFQR